MKSGKYIISGGVIADGADVFISNGAILICDGKIRAIGTLDDSARWRVEHTDAENIEVGGRLIMPAFLNPHHHLYSSLAVGFSPEGETNTFQQILENLWWKLDKVLDEESVYISALVGLIDSVKHGVTMIFDHHASMEYVNGSLNAIAETFKLADIRGVLCFETSERVGDDEVLAHIDENLAFYEKHRDSNTIKGVFGMHANFTLSDTTLRRIAEQKPDSMPVHIHCGEDACDLQYCKELGYAGPVDRLNRFGLLNENAILAHCVHLDESEYDLIERVKPFVVHNPESNANNRVGKMNRTKIKNYVLGTDGMTGDMVATLRSTYLLGSDDGITLDELSCAFFNQRYRLQKSFFQNAGVFDVGVRADIAVIDYIPKTPINNGNLMAHLIFGAKTGRTFITISNGKILYRDGEIKFINESKIATEAMAITRKLREKFYG